MFKFGLSYSHLYFSLGKVKLYLGKVDSTKKDKELSNFIS